MQLGITEVRAPVSSEPFIGQAPMPTPQEKLLIVGWASRPSSLIVPCRIHHLHLPCRSKTFLLLRFIIVIIEEPDEVKVSSPVLKTSGTGDSLAEFNHY
jgi:hypothetical protein